MSSGYSVCSIGSQELVCPYLPLSAPPVSGGTGTYTGSGSRVWQGGGHGGTAAGKVARES